MNTRIEIILTPPQSIIRFTFDLQRFSAFSGGEGSENNPYKISTVADLQQLASDVNGGNSYEGKYFLLTGTINLSGVDFAPIGSDLSHAFKGIFDGDGNTISNLTINSGAGFVGLFGCIRDAGTVKNLTLGNASLTSSNSGGFVGAIGYNYNGTIDNCKVLNSSLTASGGDSSFVGGITSYNREGTVSNVVVGNTSITNNGGNDSKTGGIAGKNDYYWQTGGNLSNALAIDITFDTAAGYRGAICGYGNSGTVDGIYINCGDFSGIGKNYMATDKTASAYSLTLSEGITVKSGALEYDGKYYAKSGATVELTASTTASNKILTGVTLSQGSGTVDGNTYTFTMPAANVTASNPVFITDYDNLCAGDGSYNNPYVLDTAEKIQCLVEDVSGGATFSDTRFRITSGVGTAEYVIGNASNRFSGGAYLESGIKAKFNGGDTIEFISGEIYFSDGSIGKLDAGDKFKFGANEYTVCDGVILSGGKVLPFSNGEIFGIAKLTNWIYWQDTVTDTITIKNSNARTFYDTEGKIVATFSNNTLTKVDSDAQITTIDADEISGNLEIDNAFYAAAPTVKIANSIVGVDMNGNKFSVIANFQFDGTKLLSGRALLDEGQSVNIGDKFVTATAGGCYVNVSNGATYVEALDKGDKVTVGDDLYEIFAGGVIKTVGTEKFYHSKFTSFMVGSNDGWSAANFVNSGDTITCGTEDKIFIDDEADRIAILTSARLNSVEPDVAATLTVDVGTDQCVIDAAFSKIKSGENYYTVHAKTQSYRVEGTTVWLAWVNSVEFGDTTFTVDDDTTVTKAEGGNTWKKSVNISTDTLDITDGDDWNFYGGTVEMTDSLMTTDGKTLTVTGGTITATAQDGALKSVAGFAVSDITSCNYADNKITLNLGDKTVALDADDNQITIGDKTVTIGDNVIFDNTTALLMTDTKNFTADENILTIDGSKTSGVKITGNALANGIIGGAGDDELTGGEGADTFVYSGGNDTITDYVDGTDKISLSDVSITGEGKLIGDDVKFATTDGSLLIKGAANLQTIEIDDKTYILEEDEFNAAGTAVTVKHRSGDFHANSTLYSITASQENSTLIANAKNNTVIIHGGGENILTGGLGNDSFKFTTGGGIVTDYGIGATKNGDGTATTANGVDIVKVDGKVNGIYFERDGNTKNTATFTATIVYGDENQVIVLKDIVKKPTKTGNSPIYQTNDVAAATLKIWDTSSGSKQSVLSAAKLKKLFHDDNDDSFTEILQAKTDYLVDISKGITPENNPFATQLTFSNNKPKD